MTTPVYMKSEDEKNKMEFVMPSKFNMDNISSPNDTSISIYETQAKYFACVRYGGYSNSSKFQEHSTRLSEKLREMDQGDFEGLSFSYIRKNFASVPYLQ